MKVHFDMETGDPDDSLALAVLATHPRVTLTGVTIHPGGLDQVATVKHVLRIVGREDVPVGASPPKDDKQRVSAFHHVFYGKADPAEPDGTASEILEASWLRGATLVTGAALTNVRRYLNETKGEFFTRIVVQGGFAGDNVVPEEHRLEKFRGRVTCPTYNLGGNPKASLEILGSPRVRDLSLVSKNVCHGASTTVDELEAVEGSHYGFELLRRAVAYFESKGHRKALHDLVAVGCALDPSVATWVEGEPYREKGEWGFRPGEGHRRITVALDLPKLLRVLAG